MSPVDTLLRLAREVSKGQHVTARGTYHVGHLGLPSAVLKHSATQAMW